MTRHSHRKQPIRTRMRQTGEAYSVAARRVGTSTELYSRTEWRTAGWQRVLPLIGFDLEFVITTATALDHDGDLDDLFAWTGLQQRADLRLGTRAPLAWFSPDTDVDTRAMREAAREAFAEGVRSVGLLAPTNVGQLASVLVALGLYEHTVDGGTHRWRAPDVVPEPGMVMDLPAAWLALDDRARWLTRAGQAALELYEVLADGKRHRILDTTISRLATDLGQPPEWTRDSLEGLWRSGGATLWRNSVEISSHDLQRLADHARIQVQIDWTRLDEQFRADPDDGWSNAEITWDTSPWRWIDSFKGSPHIDPGTLELMAAFRFAMQTSSGGKRFTNILEMSADMSLSISACVDALIELEGAGLIAWDQDNQQAVLGLGIN
jgi:Family of unknown function (DUF6042)